MPHLGPKVSISSFEIKMIIFSLKRRYGCDEAGNVCLSQKILRKSLSYGTAILLLFLLLLFTAVLSEWDFSHWKFRLLFPGKASCDRVVLPNLLCMLGVLVFP